MTELDAAGPAMAALAERGECIERAMLREAPRTACEQAVAAWRSDWAGYRDIRDRAVAASRMIATFSADQQGYRAAVSEFALAQDELARTRSRCGRSHNRAQSAMAQLEHDQLLRQRHAHEIEQGRRARAELDELLEARLAEALDWGWSMPAWFTSALGAGPHRTATPAGGRPPSGCCPTGSPTRCARRTGRSGPGPARRPVRDDASGSPSWTASWPGCRSTRRADPPATRCDR